jgi:hypothetical protein
MCLIHYLIFKNYFYSIHQHFQIIHLNNYNYFLYFQYRISFLNLENSKFKFFNFIFKLIFMNDFNLSFALYQKANYLKSYLDSNFKLLLKSSFIDFKFPIKKSSF